MTINIATGELSNIATPATKTAAQIELELNTLEQELQSARELARRRSTYSYVVQSVTAAVVLGNATQANLDRANADLDKSVDATIRVAMLEQSVGELRNTLDYVRGQERTAFCQSIKQEFNSTYAQYHEQSKQLFATFKTLKQLALRYQGMTNVSLLPPSDAKLNLPCLDPASQWDVGIPTGSR